MIIFCALILASIAFHEIGHALFLGKNFVQFKAHPLVLSFSTIGLNSKLTIREYAVVVNAGWLFSLPFSIIALLFLGQTYFLLLMEFSLLVSSVDFFLYFLVLAHILFYKIKPTAKIGDISESAFGLAYWKNTLK